MQWNHFCCESFCSAKEDENGSAPCGRNYTSDLCFNNSICPFLGYVPVTILEVSEFVPVPMYLLHKINMWIIDNWDNVKWWFWERRSFEKKHGRIDDYLKNIPVKEETDLQEKEWLEKKQTEFNSWYKVALAEEFEYSAYQDLLVGKKTE